ncbi:MAG: glycosyltransferase family 2 protein [Chryseobacterium sp.]|nr:glycosyltransferase family 2 protein [Chryseobacterium sp.]
MLNNKVAVVILNWNGKSFLEKFLPIVLKYSQNVQIIVADNNSSDDSVVFLKNYFPHVSVIINPTNDGFSKGYNTALKQVNAEYYVLLNSDVEVTENWIEPIITLLDANQKIAACQPKILDYNHKTKFEYAGASGGFIDKYGYPFCRGRIFNVLEQDKGQYNLTKEVFWATGACMFVRAEAFWKVGGFDDDYFAHMEEIDLCWRMKNIGYKIYVEPKSFVYHVGGGTLNKLSPKKTFLNFRNNLITLTKNAAPHFLIFKILYRMILDGVAAFKFLFEGNSNHFTAVIKAHFSFYNHLPSTLKKRRKMRKMQGFIDSTTGIYEKNSVYAHFIKSINYYSDLK